MEVKLNKSKNFDSKILRFSPQNEEEKERSDSSIREDESIEFVTKLKVSLKDIWYLLKNLNETFTAKITPHPKMKI